MTKEEFQSKPGYEPYRKKRDWQKDLVAIRVPDFPGDGEPQTVSVGIDGVHYAVPRGEDVKVPRLVADNLRTRYQRQWSMPSKHQMQGLVFTGVHSRFYVLDLSPEKASKAVEILPAQSPSAVERLEMSKQAMVSNREDALALDAIRSGATLED